MGVSECLAMKFDFFYQFNIVKKVMKNSAKKQRKTSASLPLEGGGRRVGVKE